MSSAKVTRFSALRRSGDQPGTNEPGAPVLPPGGVTPPSPAKYGTFAWRYVVLRSERDELIRHEIERGLRIPRLVGIARIRREVRRARRGRRAVHRRKQDEVPPWIGDRPAPGGDRKPILVEPDALIRHEADKRLGWRLRRPAAAADAAAKLAPCVEGECHRGLVDERVRFIVVLPLHAVVSVNAFSIGNARRIGAPVIVRQDRQRAVRSPQDLTADAGGMIELAIRLPPVDDPRLDFEFVARKNLHAHAVEEPWRVRRHVRRLVRPVVELVIAPQADVRHEDAGFDIDPVHLVEVVAAVCLGDVPIRGIEVPLAACDARVVSRRRLRVHAELRHDASKYVVVMQVSAEPELRQLELAGSKDLARSDDRVVLRFVEAVCEIRVDAKFAGKYLAVDRRQLRAWVAGQPGEVGECKWLRFRRRVGRSGLCARLPCGEGHCHGQSCAARRGQFEFMHG